MNIIKQHFRILASAGIALALTTSLAAEPPTPPRLAAGAWVKIASPMTGVGVWVDSSDHSNVVIGFGKARAKEITHSDLGKRWTVAQAAAQPFWTNRGWSSFLLARTELLGAHEWLRAVRSGQKVGLWVHVGAEASMFDMTRFTILSVWQRPPGTPTPPWWLL